MTDNNDFEEYMTTDEVAHFLNRSKSTIYYYIKEKLLTPVSDHPKWKMRKTRMFRKTEVNSLKEKLTNPGITTIEAANQLEIPYNTLMTFIYDGYLSTERQMHQGKERHFIKEEELERFKNCSILKNFIKKKKQYYTTQNGWLLFESLIHDGLNTTARIMEMTDVSSLVITDKGESFSIQEIEENGFKAQYIYPDIPYSTRKGYAKFKFLKPYSIHDDIFQVIDYLYVEITHKNMRISVDNNYIFLDIKPVFLENLSKNFFSVLKNGLYEGNIEQQPSGVLIDSDLEQLYIHIPIHIKEIIRNRAQKENKTIEEVSIEALIKGLEN